MERELSLTQMLLFSGGTCPPAGYPHLSLLITRLPIVVGPAPVPPPLCHFGFRDATGGSVRAFCHPGRRT